MFTICEAQTTLIYFELFTSDHFHCLSWFTALWPDHACEIQPTLKFKQTLVQKRLYTVNEKVK